MVPVYAATLPPASVLPLGGSPLLAIDAFGVCVLLTAVLAIGAAILVARERANRAEGRLRLPVLDGQCALGLLRRGLSSRHNFFT